MNNPNHLDNFISKLESIKMTTEEKNKMRNRLEDFALSHQPIASPYTPWITFSRKIIATAFIAIITLGSASQFASKDALPGETFYPVKIAHENIKIATATNNTTKINLEIKRTEKRIKEAAQLAQENKLDPETQQTIARTIKKQTQKVKEHIETIKQQDPESALQLNSELKSTIKANSQVLRKVSSVKKINVENKLATPEPTLSTETIHLNQEQNSVNTAPTTTQEVDTQVTQEVDTQVTQEEVINNLDIPTLTEIDNSEIMTSETTLATTTQNIQEDVSSKTSVSAEKLQNSKEKTISTAETLLEALEQDVEEIEATEKQLEQKIIEKEIKESETPVNTAHESKPIPTEKETSASESDEEVSKVRQNTPETNIQSQDSLGESEVSVISIENEAETQTAETNSTDTSVVETSITTDEFEANAATITLQTQSLTQNKEFTETESHESNKEIITAEEILPTTSAEKITEDIKSLQDILNIKEIIEETKQQLHNQKTEITTTETNQEQGVLMEFDEALLNQQSEQFIKDKKYKQVFVILKDILEHYREQLIVIETEKELGITSETKQDTITSSEE